MVDELEAAGDLSGIAAEQHAQGILDLDDLPLEGRNGHRRGLFLDLGLAHVELRDDTAFETLANQLRRTLSGLERVVGDLQPGVEVA